MSGAAERRIALTSGNVERWLTNDTADTQANLRLEIELDPSAYYAPTREQALLLLDFGHDVTLIRRDAAPRAEEGIIYPVCPPSETKVTGRLHAEQSGQNGQNIQYLPNNELRGDRVINLPECPLVEVQAQRPPANDESGQNGKFIHSLPNTVRELLLARGEHDALRVYEALSSLGWRNGQSFDAKQAIPACAPFGISPKAVRAGLSVVDLFNLPECHPDTLIECIDSNRDNGARKRRGRPVGSSKRHRLASVANICARLDVREVYSDPLPIEALRSAKAYRSALHAALLVRAPGVYSRQLLADRVGISKRTLRRYDGQERVVTEQRYVEIEITEANAENELPLNNRREKPQNEFLSVGGEKRRFIPTLSVWRELSARGVKRAMLTRQAPNFYTVAATVSAIDGSAAKHA